MRTRLALALALTAAILAGCAAPPVAPGSAIEQAPPKGLIDAPPGEYLEFSGKLDGSVPGPVKLMRVVTKAHRLRQANDWAPTIIFCVKHKETGASYCLNTYATKDGSRFVAKLHYKDSEGATVATTRLPYDLASSDSHYLDIAFLENRLVMIIDDQEFFDHPLQAQIDEYWFSCSSIVCSVEVLYPYQVRGH